MRTLIETLAGLAILTNAVIYSTFSAISTSEPLAGVSRRAAGRGRETSAV